MNPLPRPESDRLVASDSPDIQRLREIMARLRAPEDGCPWDQEQDFSTIAPYTIEEAYEVEDAIARNDMGDLCDELGDLLLQVVYHAQMGEEAGAFTFDEVVRGINDKMIRRHPHVFGNDRGARTAEQQTSEWESIKAGERAAQGKAKPRTLENIPVGLPALTRALKLQKRAARVGFDWPETGQVLDKLQEEAVEIVEARENSDPDHLEDEIGDFLFVAANLARHLDVDPEAALRRANAKFIRRFEAIEDALETMGKTPSDSSLSEMDALWDAAKAAEKRNRNSP